MAGVRAQQLHLRSKAVHKTQPVKSKVALLETITATARFQRQAVTAHDWRRSCDQVTRGRRSGGDCVIKQRVCRSTPTVR